MPPPKSEDYCSACGDPLDPVTARCWGCRWEHEQYEERCRRARLPPAAHPKSFSCFVVDPVQRAALRALRSSSAPHYLWGKTGTGKTHLFWAVAWDAIEQKREVLYIDWAGYLQELRDSFLAHQLARVYHQARAVDLLCLDDLSIVRWSVWSTEQFYLLVEERLNYERRTLLAALLPPHQLVTRLPEHLLSRLQCSFTVLQLPPRDGRRHPYPQQKLLLET